MTHPKHLDQAFSQLREKITEGPTTDQQALIELILFAQQKEPALYQEVWIPYLEEHQEALPNPLLACGSLSSLEQWAKRAPYAKFEFHSAELLQNDCQGLKDFLETPLARHVSDLSLSEFTLSEEHLRWVAKADTLEDLRYLNLAGARCDEGISVLLEELSLPALKGLSLGSLEDPEELIAALFNIGLPDHVEELDLSDNQLDEYAYELPELPCLPQLKSLDLSDNGIEQEAMLALLGSPRLPQLRSLQLSGNELDDECLQVLATSALFSDLESLDLSDNESELVTDEGYLSLLGSPSLSSLEELYTDFWLMDENLEDVLSVFRLSHLRHWGVNDDDLSGDSFFKLAASPCFHLALRRHYLSQVPGPLLEAKANEWGLDLAMKETDSFLEALVGCL